MRPHVKMTAVRLLRDLTHADIVANYTGKIAFPVSVLCFVFGLVRCHGSVLSTFFLKVTLP